MSLKFLKLTFFVFFFLLSLTEGSNVLAHQPVMDMAPRWVEGFGIQSRYEAHYSDKVLNGGDSVDNPLGRDRFVQTTWIEGVYTLKREIRGTFKLPIIYKTRTIVRNGVAIKKKGSGVGDLILGLPLKHYDNWKGGTQNFGFTPSIRLPTGLTGGDYPPGDGSVDTGFSLNHSFESPLFYTFVEAFYWINTKGHSVVHQGDEIGLDGNIGIHPYHNNKKDMGIFVMLDVTVRHEMRGRDRAGNTGGFRLSLGPVLVLYKHNIMLRAEYKMPVLERRSGEGVAYGQELNVGIGITF